MEKIKFYVYKVILNKFALGYLVKGWSFLKGLKEQRGKPEFLYRELQKQMKARREAMEREQEMSEVG